MMLLFGVTARGSFFLICWEKHEKTGSFSTVWSDISKSNKQKRIRFFQALDQDVGKHWAMGQKFEKLACLHVLGQQYGKKTCFIILVKGLKNHVFVFLGGQPSTKKRKLWPPKKKRNYRRRAVVCEHSRVLSRPGGSSSCSSCISGGELTTRFLAAVAQGSCGRCAGFLRALRKVPEGRTPKWSQTPKKTERNGATTGNRTEATLPSSRVSLVSLFLKFSVYFSIASSYAAAHQPLTAGSARPCKRWRARDSSSHPASSPSEPASRKPPSFSKADQAKRVRHRA